MRQCAYIFDYGATLDTRGEHWSKVFYRAYQKCGYKKSWEEFWETYKQTERRLGKGDIIRPTDTFHEVLRKKVEMHGAPKEALDMLYNETKEVIEESREVLERLHQQGCPMVLVSNFYGNIETVLGEFGLSQYFIEVIESAQVGIRKPDPRIWQLGIEALQKICPTLQPQDITVVGDSMEKDILPAQTLGCNTILREIGTKLNIQNEQDKCKTC